MKRGFNKLWSENIWWVVELTLTWSNRKDRRLSKISLIVNPAKGCLTCSYIHIYMQNKSRPNSRKKYWCKSPTPAVSWDRQSALGGERGRVGAYLPKWVPRTEIVQPTVPQKRQLTHALPQVRASFEGYKHQLSSVAVITTFYTVPVTKALFLWTHPEPCNFV